MRSPRSRILIALVVSAALHLLTMTEWVPPAGSPPSEPLQVRLLPPPPAPAPAPGPAARPPPPAPPQHPPAVIRPRRAAPGPQGLSPAAPAVPPALAAQPSQAPPPTVPASPLVPSSPLAPASPSPAPVAQSSWAEAGAAGPGAAGPGSGPPGGAAEAAAEPAIAGYPFSSVVLEFDLLYGEAGMHLGTVRHTLRVEDGQYAMEEVAEGHGLIGALVERVIGGQYIVRSSGSIGQGGFMPQEYFAQRGRPERRERAIFNWDRGSIDLYWRDEQRTLPLPPGTQDVLSSMHQLYFMRPLPAQGLFEIASGRKLAQTPFEVLGTEQIPTALGERRAVHIRRLDPDGDRVELWLDPVSQLLPLRVYAAYRNADPMDFVIRRMAVVPAEGH